MEPYGKKVMQHFRNPHNVGEIKKADGIGNVGNPTCGDIMRLYIKVKAEIIVDAKFKTFGCGAAIATSSMVTDLIKGKTIKDALAVSNKAVAQALGGLPPIKMHCSVLAEQALKAAIDDYLTKRAGKVEKKGKGKSKSSVKASPKQARQKEKALSSKITKKTKKKVRYA